MKCKYLVPKGTYILRRRVDRYIDNGIIQLRRHPWETFVTTKNAYYNDRDLIKESQTHWQFVVPCTTFDMIQVNRDDIVDI